MERPPLTKGCLIIAAILLVFAVAGAWFFVAALRWGASG